MAKTLNQFLEGTGILKVKSPDEQRFVDKHVTATIADRNGNGDDVFKGSKVKKIDRRKERHGYETGEDAKVYEEVELEEVTIKLAQDTFDKRRNQFDNARRLRDMAKDNGLPTKRYDDVALKAGRKAYTDYGHLDRKQMAKEEAGYSAKAGAAGKDLGKPGKNFAKIARGAAAKYGSEAAGERVAGAVLKKLRKEDRLINLLDTVTESQAYTMVTVFNSLSEENQNMFLASCETEEGVEKMLDFSIQNRGAE
jgi:hypothetical protein